MNKYLSVLDSETARVSIIQLDDIEVDTIMTGDTDDVISVAGSHGITLNISCDWMLADGISLKLNTTELTA